jgi:hypothetical protein
VSPESINVQSGLNAVVEDGAVTHEYHLKVVVGAGKPLVAPREAVIDSPTCAVAIPEMLGKVVKLAARFIGPTLAAVTEVAFAPTLFTVPVIV